MTKTTGKTTRKPPGATPARSNGTALHADSGPPLHRCVSEALDGYFAELDGASAHGLYELVMTEVERPLLKAVMSQVGDNQTQAAGLLGLSRGTLRKKLKQHGLLGG